MIHIATFLVSLGGLALLLLAMPRHQQDWLGRKLFPMQRRALRLSGFTMLALAFVVAGSGRGWAYGAVAWFGWLTVAAALVVVVNTNRDRFRRKVRP
ncbi:DUF3325 domain-containing protein [Sphingobium terrigena]|uniref:DUF3325 domain-containing protein n=1 Tax=Sphingobium terrigena TaxID=2304063 RepID=A0A418YUU8_9SPHN|nr:DUF3325 domain-containing protein [Sphingobium terrigena]RJG55899.1 DUF3325 domain-containing protein [Sphingobium terrigena]